MCPGAPPCTSRPPHASAKALTRAGSTYRAFSLATAIDANGSRASGTGAKLSISGLARCPARSAGEVGAQLARYVEFLHIQKRPDQRGVSGGDLMGTGDDLITLDEIQEAEKTGKQIDLPSRGAK